jgi:hypothetical protein
VNLSETVPMASRNRDPNNRLHTISHLATVVIGPEIAYDKRQGTVAGAEREPPPITRPSRATV